MYFQDGSGDEIGVGSGQKGDGTRDVVWRTDSPQGHTLRSLVHCLGSGSRNLFTPQVKPRHQGFKAIARWVRCVSRWLGPHVNNTGRYLSRWLDPHVRITDVLWVRCLFAWGDDAWRNRIAIDLATVLVIPITAAFAAA